MQIIYHFLGLIAIVSRIHLLFLKRINQIMRLILLNIQFRIILAIFYNVFDAFLELGLIILSEVVGRYAIGMNTVARGGVGMSGVHPLEIGGIIAILIILIWH